MAVAIFDLDNTLIAGDSDHAWGEFLVEKGLVGREDYRQKNDHFYRQYQAGDLDIQAYLEFVSAPLVHQSMETLTAWHDEFVAEKVRPLLLPKARELIQKHRDRGDTLLIITATNAFVAGPICILHGIPDYIASELEIVDNRFSGKPIGTPSYKTGKIARLNQWLQDNRQSMQGSYGYSDSINDVPLLEAVDNPFVVDGDAALIEHAKQRGWPCISLR